MSVPRQILTGAGNSVQGRRIRSPVARSRRIAACRWNTSPCGSYTCGRLLGPVFGPAGLKHHQLQAVCEMTWLVMRLPRSDCGRGPRRPNPAVGFLPLDETRARRIQQKSYTCCSLIPSSARSQPLRMGYSRTASNRRCRRRNNQRQFYAARWRRRTNTMDK